MHPTFSLQVSAPFWCSTSLTIPSGRKDFPIHDGDDYNFHNSGGLVHEATAVRDCLLKGKFASFVQCSFDSLAD